MAEPKIEIIGTIKLAEILADKFVDCIIKFNNGTWKPKLGGHATVNFLHFPNGKNVDPIGTSGFMRSVALEMDIFLESGYDGIPHSKTKYDALNKNGNVKRLQINRFATAVHDTAEILLKNKNVIKLIPDSITIISTGTGGSKNIFKGGQESSDWGDETPPNQTPLNTTDSSKTQNPLNIPRTNEEKRYAYYKTLARPEQSNFRKILLEEYNNACVITGCTTQAALEAAHIIPFSQDGADTLENGLLLRADLHLLFDKGFMAINPETSEVHFKETDKNYNKYTHAKIPDNDKLHENLTAHWEKYDG